MIIFLRANNYVKENSEIWKLAKKLSNRKYCLWKPLVLVSDNTVKVYSIIRGNEWEYDLTTLKLLDKRKGINETYQK